MFIKKDVRKIPQILDDATSRAVASPPSPTNDDKTNDNDIITEMRFARRGPEFLPSCSVSMVIQPRYVQRSFNKLPRLFILMSSFIIYYFIIILVIQPRYQPALDNLVQLSLYDCGLSTLAGLELDVDRLGVPTFPKLESLDIGRNPKLNNKSIPDTFHTQFPKLTELWLDDCGFGPNIPHTLLDLKKLQVVKMSGNKLEGELEDGIGINYWKNVKVLAFDGNQLTSVGNGIGKLKHLEKLHLRGNQLTNLPEGVPGLGNTGLTMLSLSSNQLKVLPSSLVECVTLTELYFNGNQIEQLPEGIAEKLVGLKKFNLAHNAIGKGHVPSATQLSQSFNDGDAIMEEDVAGDILPNDFVERFGLPENLSGNCTKDESCMARLEGNPLSEAIRKRHLEEEKRKAKEAAAKEAAEREEAEAMEE